MEIGGVSLKVGRDGRWRHCEEIVGEALGGERAESWLVPLYQGVPLLDDRGRVCACRVLKLK
jgi:hypothetical protein